MSTTTTRHIFTDMEPRAASPGGGLDHHVMICSCGYEAASTMPTLVAEYARGHLDYFSAATIAKRGSGR